MKKFFIFIFCFSFLIVGQSALAKMKSDVLNYIPQLNPTPKYFMTVQGNIDPALKNKIKLIWTADYETTNPTCRKAVSAAEGAYESRGKFFNYQTKPDALGNYQIKIPLDQLKEGVCGWKIATLSYSINKIDKTIFTFLSDKYFQIKNPSPINNIQCDTSSNCDYKRVEYFNNIRAIKRNKIYQYNLNLYLK